jgi:hypothetical protein
VAQPPREPARDRVSELDEGLALALLPDAVDEEDAQVCCEIFRRGGAAWCHVAIVTPMPLSF